MKRKLCKKGKSTKIISNFGKGYPQTFNVSIASNYGKKVSGTFIEKRYFWIFPQKPIEGELKTSMQFHRKWINGIYSVTIIPDCDVEVIIG